MASSLEPIGVLAGLLFSALRRYNVLGFYKVGLSPFTLSDALGPSLRYRRARVGRFLAALSYVSIASTLVDLEAVRKTHLNINRWSNEEVLAWKGSYVSGCSATAVAAAIFASVGLSALSLPNMDATHWSARALLSASMAVGILSVTYATYQQNIIGMMNNAQEIRIWLSCGKADRGPKEARTDFWKFIARIQGGSIDYDPPYSLFPLESSMAAQMKIQLPSTLLQLAIFLYLTGFGLYVLFAWVENAILPSLDYRAIFIVYMIAVGLVLSYFWTLSIFNQVDQQKRQQDFELDSTELKKPNSQKQLDQWLKLIRDIQAFELGPRQTYEALEAELQELKKVWEEARRAREVADFKRSRSELPKSYSIGNPAPPQVVSGSTPAGRRADDIAMTPMSSGDRTRLEVSV